MASKDFSLGSIVISTLVAWLLLFTPSATAFFGNDCKKPKASYERYLEAAQRLKASEDKAKRLVDERYRMLKTEYEICNISPKKFFREKRLDPKQYGKKNIRCFFWFESLRGTTLRLSQAPQPISSYDQYKNAMLVIKSYKKCFDPENYIAALEWLRKNK